MRLTDSIEDQVDSRLRAIANELFGPSTSTLAAVALGGESVLASLPPDLQDRLASPEFARQIEVLRNTFAEAEGIDRTPFLTPAPRGATVLARGQICVVDGVDLNDPESEVRHTEPVMVLLDRPVQRNSEADEPGTAAWQAWTVSAHAGFAGYWDVLLQGEGVPGACGMVQVWNIVTVAEPHLGRCRYQLSDEQQAAVNSVWAEFISGEAEPSPEEAGNLQWMTAGLRVTAHGATVVTGSASTGPEDPRFLFQRFYVLVREALSSACRRAAAPRLTPEPSDGKTHPWVDALVEFDQLMQRLSFKGLHDGSITAAPELREAALTRLNPELPSNQQPESVWIQTGSYSSREQELSIGFLRNLFQRVDRKSIQFEFFVVISVLDEETRTSREEFVRVEGKPFKDDFGVFVISSRLPAVERVLAGKVDLDIEVRSSGASRHLVKITFRAS